MFDAWDGYVCALSNNRKGRISQGQIPKHPYDVLPFKNSHDPATRKSTRHVLSCTRSWGMSWIPVFSSIFGFCITPKRPQLLFLQKMRTRPHSERPWVPLHACTITTSRDAFTITSITINTVFSTNLCFSYTAVQQHYYKKQHSCSTGWIYYFGMGAFNTNSSTMTGGFLMSLSA